MLKIKQPAKTNANGEEERLLLETKIFQTYLMHYSLRTSAIQLQLLTGITKLQLASL
jgi:hypothetical protein